MGLCCWDGLVMLWEECGVEGGMRGGGGEAEAENDDGGLAPQGWVGRLVLMR
jgi:hypothetical protein